MWVMSWPGAIRGECNIQWWVEVKDGLGVYVDYSSVSNNIMPRLLHNNDCNFIIIFIIPFTI